MKEKVKVVPVDGFSIVKKGFTLMLSLTLVQVKLYDLLFCYLSR